MSKLIHNYHPVTGEFVSTTSADPSPLEPGVFLIPACATEVAPPYVQDGHVAVFDGAQWSSQLDTRGEWFDASHQSVLIEAIGADVASLTRVAPPSPAHDLVNGEWVINQARSVELAAKEFTAAIQRRLDAFARERNYDGILSACTYATSSVAKFKADGQACVNLRDATWSAAYDILSQVQAGTRPMPQSIADIEADLPALVWPA